MSDSDDQENHSAVTTNSISAQNGVNTTTQHRKLCYRELLNKIEGIEESEDLGLDTVKDLGQIIKEVNNIELECNIKERYTNPDETLLDSLVLSSASNVLVKCTQAVDVNIATYEPKVFAEKLKEFVSIEGDYQYENLEGLILFAQRLIPELPEYYSLYGAFDLNAIPQPKKKKERRKAEKEVFQRKQPEKLSRVDSEEKGIEEIVKTLFEVLNKYYQKNDQNPINYYDYVIDTDSYTQTVENMFYCSFLVRDGRARIDIDNYGTPFIKPARKRELENFQTEGGKYSQIISTMTILQWETFSKPGYLQRYNKKHQSRH